MSGAVLKARPAFDMPPLAPNGGALLATERMGLGIASLSARRGQRAALEQRLFAEFGLRLPQGPHRHVVGDTAVLGTGVDSWLLMAEQSGNDLSRRLKSTVGDSGSVTDQSDAYAVLRLSGPALRDTLAKLVSIDVHVRSFAVGAVAATVLAHMGVLLCRLADGEDAQPVFEIAVFRSFAASLWHEIVSHSP